MGPSLWQQCLQNLRDKIPQDQFSQWISPLQAEETPQGVILFAHNEYILDTVRRDYLATIEAVVAKLKQGQFSEVSLVKGLKRASAVPVAVQSSSGSSSSSMSLNGVDTKITGANGSVSDPNEKHQSHLNPTFTFTSFVEGKSNQLARAAAMQPEPVG